MSPRAVRAREAAGAAWPLADQPALCAQLLEDYLLADLMPGLFAATPITRRGAELSVAFVPHPLYAIYAGRMYRFDWDTAAATLTLRFAIAGPAVFRALEPDLRVRLVSDVEVEVEFAALHTSDAFLHAVPALRLACTTAFAQPWLFLRLYQRVSPLALLADVQEPVREGRAVVYAHKSILRHISPWDHRRIDLHYYLHTPGELGEPPSVHLRAMGQPPVAYPLLLAADAERICDDVCRRML